ncbi:p23 Wos2 [Schizosaccharomyces octosporus yFS286]|uniref:P23 Wos2 n=1 Tax=Schizosaccharomyces octosporus (strain yFS286) TaxID=483514 RepID=S9QWQ9_SCHOY|nr:p23 Wos2 [Schizosaccharomyces octosporus yFS286]EPX70750.1 p23 Wos2 [Schizosaccharomyces octosporus yFS286]
MSGTQIPEVLWAQRSHPENPEKNVVYLTVVIPDAVEPKINLTSEKLVIDSKSGAAAHYAVQIDFFKEIDTEKSKYSLTGRNIFFVLFKKELQEEFWPRLTKEKLRLHWLRTDFERWVDEDEQEAQPEAAANPFGAGGMPDLSALGGMGGMEGMDFSQLGNMGANMGGQDDEEESSEPELEEADEEEKKE